MTFGPQPTTSDVLRGVDLSGRTIVLTGGSGGLGFETARSLVSAGAAVVLLDKDATRGERSVQRLREISANVEYLVLDLTDHDGIRATAARLVTALPRIDVLINNAGAVFGERTVTAFGWEATLATNFLGHFLLTTCLAPALRAAKGRVVNLGSGAHRRSGIVWDDPHFARRPYVPREAYAQSKTAVALGTLGFEDRLGGGVHAYTVRPGVVATGLYADLTDEQQAAFSSRVAGGGTGMSVEQAAATTVWAATSPDLADAGGGYLASCAVAGTPDAPSADGAHAPRIFDRTEADRLWQLAEHTTEQEEAS
jgi:NAD(P)-dependent dehydrogenase (short-subunit alcohol dehydrogenase family)